MEKLRPPPPALAKTLSYVVMALLYVPLIVMLIGAFRDNNTQTWTLRWFFELADDSQLIEATQRSLLISTTAAGIATLIAFFSSLSLQRENSWLRGFLQRLIDGALVMPEIVFALSLLAWFSILQLPLGYFSMITAHITFILSFAVLIIGARLQSIGNEFEQAAADLGAGQLQYFRRVLFPLLAPAILSGFILTFLLSFDDFLISYFVSGAGADTLPIKLYARAKMGYSAKVNAISTILMAVTAVLTWALLRLGVLTQITKKKNPE